MDGIKIGLIGGSGLGEAMRAHAEGEGAGGGRHEVDTPFGRPSDAVVEFNWSGLPVFFLSRHGPGHVLNPSQVPYRANLLALKQLGVTHVIASGAVGSLRDDFKPRDLVIPDQVIDKTFRRAGTFFERSAVHVEFSEPFCPVLRRILVEEGQKAEDRGSNVEDRGEASAPSSPSSILDPQSSTPYTVHDRGCYVCMEGPAFSTRAESLMHRLWGGDLIGMTAMPEAKLAREAEMSYALVALVTDYDCWRRPPAAKGAAAAGQSGVGASTPPGAAPDPHVLLKEIIANLQAATDNAVTLIRRAVARMATRQDELAAAPAREALKLAIWSDKGRIPREEVELLGPLWMKYFER
jgi:5'-methylthioadenosine phosphorylase